MNNPNVRFSHVLDANGHVVPVSISFHDDAVSSTPIQVSTVPCYVRWVEPYNVHASDSCFLKIYDKATAPTVGTDAPVRTIFVPADGSNPQMFIDGFVISSKLWIAVTKLMADSDTTAPTSAILVDMGYAY